MPPKRESHTTPRRRGAIGVLKDGHRYLLVQRAAGIVMGGSWCFPGGHVETGENSRAAVVRELLEELGIEVRPRHRLGSLRVPSGTHVLATWLIPYDGSPIRPDPGEIAAIKWLTIAEIREQPGGLPSNETVLEMLASYKASGRR